jgi:hypothetical protein
MGIVDSVCKNIENKCKNIDLFERGMFSQKYRSRSPDDSSQSKDQDHADVSSQSEGRGQGHSDVSCQDKGQGHQQMCLEMNMRIAKQTGKNN